MPRAPRRSRRAGAIAGCAALLASPLAAADRDDADASTGDPVRVHYDGGDCVGDAIEIEVFDREAEAWHAHPVHPRVPVPSCQVEDAGRLLNELRWRCAASDPAFPPPWRPLAVFDPAVMSHCAAEPIAADAPRAAITVESPREGVPVQASEPVLTLLGRVSVDGRQGGEDDVAFLLDRSAPGGALTAQVASARDLVNALAPRLGPLRFALLSRPGRPVDPARARPGARRDLAWSDDPAAIEGALARLAPAPAPSSPSLDAALAAVAEAFDAGREGARRTLVAGVDGRLLDAGRAPRADDPLLAAASRLAAAGVAIHWVALGGVAAEDPPRVRRLLEVAPGSFRRVPPRRYGAPLFAGLSLPVVEAVWIERRGETPRVDATLGASGRFEARVPVRAGSNHLVITARTSDGARVRHPFELVFDDAQLPERVLERERARIRAAQKKRLELRVDEEEEAGGAGAGAPP